MCDRLATLLLTVEAATYPRLRSTEILYCIVFVYYTSWQNATSITYKYKMAVGNSLIHFIGILRFSLVPSLSPLFARQLIVFFITTLIFHYLFPVSLLAKNLTVPQILPTSDFPHPTDWFHTLYKKIVCRTYFLHLLCFSSFFAAFLFWCHMSDEAVFVSFRMDMKSTSIILARRQLNNTLLHR